MYKNSFYGISFVSIKQYKLPATTAVGYLIEDELNTVEQGLSQYHFISCIIFSRPFGVLCPPWFALISLSGGIAYSQPWRSNNTITAPGARGARHNSERYKRLSAVATGNALLLPRRNCPPFEERRPCKFK